LTRLSRGTVEAIVQSCKCWTAWHLKMRQTMSRNFCD
jgi:hypothetical protein